MKKRRSKAVTGAPGVPAWLATHNNNAKIGAFVGLSKLKS